MNENTYRRHIDALEAQNRQLRRIFKLASLSAGLLCILAIAGWRGGGIQDALTARSLRIVNADGNTVVVLGVADSQGGFMRIANRDQFPLVATGVNEDGTGFAYEGFDLTGKRRFVVGMEKGSTKVGMQLSSVTIPRRDIRIGQFENDLAGISLFGEGPKPRFQLTLGANEETSLDMYNGKGGRTSCWFGRDAKSTMMFLGEANTPANGLTLNAPTGAITSKAGDGVGSTWPPPK